MLSFVPDGQGTQGGGVGCAALRCAAALVGGGLWREDMVVDGSPGGRAVPAGEGVVKSLEAESNDGGGVAALWWWVEGCRGLGCRHQLQVPSCWYTVPLLLPVASVDTSRTVRTSFLVGFTVSEGYAHARLDASHDTCIT